MGTLQIIVLALMGISLLINAHLHGKPKTGHHNFWVSLISSCITLTLLYFGNFFN